jgi:hypothetical protein
MSAYRTPGEREQYIEPKEPMRKRLSQKIIHLSDTNKIITWFVGASIPLSLIAFVEGGGQVLFHFIPLLNGRHAPLWAELLFGPIYFAAFLLGISVLIYLFFFKLIPLGRFISSFLFETIMQWGRSALALLASWIGGENG